jgi:hypothetical protein
VISMKSVLLTVPNSLTKTLAGVTDGVLLGSNDGANVSGSGVSGADVGKGLEEAVVDGDDVDGVVVDGDDVDGAVVDGDDVDGVVVDGDDVDGAVVDGDDVDGTVMDGAAVVMTGVAEGGAESAGGISVADVVGSTEG